MASTMYDGLIGLSVDENCNRDCARCLPAYFPRYFLQNREGVEKYRIGTEAAFDDMVQFTVYLFRKLEQLQHMLRQYGDGMWTKWKKMSRTKREQLLLSADEQLARHKWSELRVMLNMDKSGEILDGVKLFPYLSVELLRDDPMRLLSLLHHRSSAMPEAWVSFDREQVWTAFHLGAIWMNYSECCVTMHGDWRSYGCPVAWNRSDCHSQLIMPYPLARAVIGAQCHLFTFLVKMVEATIVPGQTREGNGEWIKRTTAGFKASGQLEFWSSHSNRAFSAPVQFDPSTSLKSAKAQLGAARDHLRFLQTEPEYLHRYLQQRNAEVYSLFTVEEMWQDLANDVLMTPIQNVRHLRCIVDKCEEVLEIYQELKEHIRPFRRLPEKYERALYTLHEMAKVGYYDDCDFLYPRLCKSPGFERNVLYRKSKDGAIQLGMKYYKKDLKEEAQKAEIREFVKEDPLHWALLELSGRPNILHRKDPSWFMSFIEDHLAEADHKERSRIDQALYDFLAVMAFNHQIMMSIDSSRPRPNTFKPRSSDDRQSRIADRYNISIPTALTREDRSELGLLMKAFFEKPWPKGKYKSSWIEDVKEIRNRQAKLWTAVRTIHRRHCIHGGLRADDVETEILELSADLEPSHLKEVEEEYEALREEIAKSSTAPGPSQLQPPQTQWGPSINAKLELVERSKKAKTKAENAMPVEIPDTAYAKANEVPKPLSIQVNAESQRIFSRIFSRHREEHKGTVKWQQVVTAMADAGFAATHNGGSVVSFEPVSNDLVGSIVFHKPHPDLTVDPIMLHAMGRRLQKWFGLSQESFVEREKAVKEEEQK